MRHLSEIEKAVGKACYLTWRKDVEREYDNSTRPHTRMASREKYVAAGIQRHYEHYLRQGKTKDGQDRLRCVDE